MAAPVDVIEAHDLDIRQAGVRPERNGDDRDAAHPQAGRCERGRIASVPVAIGGQHEDIAIWIASLASDLVDDVPSVG